MPITVAALMTPAWLLRHLRVPDEATHLIVPGYLNSGIATLQDKVNATVICGPNDIRDLSEVFGKTREKPALDTYSIEIIAEINHAPRLSIQEVLLQAKRLRDQGANRIDFGCDPSNRCQTIGDYVKALVDEGHRVSVDSFDEWEVRQAIQNDASLVLSVNSTNMHQAIDWGVEIVVIPDAVEEEKNFFETVDFLTKHAVKMRLDPILEPIGSGFAKSLIRYAQVRERFPETAMMMGIGNLTELTEVDSAGVNFLLLAICEELDIRSVLTTQVINWARSSVHECDIARRLVHYSLSAGVPPKHLSNDLVMLRDVKVRDFDEQTLARLAESLKDNNYRLFAQNGALHLISAGLHLTGTDPFKLFEQLMLETQSRNVDQGHAFYLGYEMAKAMTALQLGKQYNQDQALNWGFLTQVEDLHRLKRGRK